MKNRKAISVLTLSLGIFVAGCAGSEGPAGPPGAGVTVAITAEAAGTNCATGGYKVDFQDPEGTVLNSIFVCDGANGDSPVVTAENPGTNCDLGGVKVDYLGTVSYVCNGETGANGTNGQSVTVTVEAAGAKCAAGGLKIVSATGTDYVCNGAAGTAGQSVSVTVETAGSNCANGGLKLVSASGTNYVCNGAPGANGTNGTNGSNGTNGTNGTNGIGVLVTPISSGGVCGQQTGVNVNDDDGVADGVNVCAGMGVIVTPIPSGGVCGQQTGVNVNDDDGVADGVNVCAGMGVIVTPISSGGVCGQQTGVNVNDDDGVADGVNICEGADGISCWDLDGDGVGDLPDEDINNDGVVDVWDCTWALVDGGSVEGYVLYGLGWPAEGAEVYLASQAQSALTDRFGYYRFDNVPVGAHHTLEIQAENHYLEVIQDVHVTAGRVYPVPDVFLSYRYAGLKGNFELSGSDATFQGKTASDLSGYMVSGAGDVNGDGFADIIIGASNANPGGKSNAGEAYLFYGRPSLRGSLDLSQPDVVFQGKTAEDWSGASVSGAGDVNGDGFDDILIGAPFADPGGNSAAGETYLIYGSATLSGTINLANANATFQGKAVDDNSGVSISGAGDVNGDGFDDILIGAYYANPSGNNDAGETYLVYGGTSLPNKWPLAVTVPNVTLTGKAVTDFSGLPVSEAGDVNGDGFDDILIGAYGADPGGNSAAGETYLIYGSSSLPATIGLASANATFPGKAVDDQSGRKVSGAGDINGDGFDDILIGARLADPDGKSGAGETYLVYGSAALSGTIGLAGANATFTGKAVDDWSGASISGAGDINGDGFGDILIGAYGANVGSNADAGETYLIYGSATLSGMIGLASADATFTGKAASDNSGISISGAGDINGDNYDDILIGADQADVGSNADAGEAYLVCGGLEPQKNRNARELAGTHSLGQADAVFQGKVASDQSGYSVSDAGDVNGDGYADLLIGAYMADPAPWTSAGETYLYYGRPSLDGVFELSRPDVVFQGKWDADYSGCSVSGAGDVNGDGFDDILIGAYGADPGGNSSAGETYLIFGRSTLTGTMSLGGADVTFQGKTNGDNSGYSVSGAGDMNGDGFDDILIGAYGADPGGNSSAGETYLIFGRSTLTGTMSLGGADVTFQGKTNGDNSGYSVSGAGDMNGDGFDDILIGAYGADPGGNSSAGETYLIYGSATLSWTVGLASANATFSGKAATDYSGRAVSGAGDVNGDGFDDILIGANGADPGGNSTAGETYLIYGGSTLSGAIGLAGADAVFQGKAANDNSSRAVSGAGDVNGDGFDDILIGALGANGSAGETYLIYGNSTLTGTIGLASANATFQGKAATDSSGRAVSGAGDVNGDGFDDILIGAYQADVGASADAGETYLIYGGLTLSGAIGLAGADAVFQGKAASDDSGYSISGSGDMNGDGFGDIFIGAYMADPHGLTNAGESYLIYGSGRRPLD